MKWDRLLPSDQKKIEKLEDQFQEVGQDIEDLDEPEVEVHQEILKFKN